MPVRLNVFLLSTLAFCVALTTGNVAAQTLPDPVLGQGDVRLSTTLRYDAWRTRGVEDESRTGFSQEVLAPGLEGLAEALSALVNTAGPNAVSLGLQSSFVERVHRTLPLGFEIGALDWLTLAAELPFVQTRLFGEADIDSDLASLGVNPLLERPDEVRGFLSRLGERAEQAAALAAELCGTTPGAPTCNDATQTAQGLLQAAGLFQAAYASSAFFPAVGTAAGAELAAWSANVDAELTQLGLSPLGAQPPLGTAPLSAAVLSDLQGPGGVLAGSPLNAVKSVWRPGDLALRASVRVLDFAFADDSAQGASGHLRVALMGGVRLPTGAAPDSLDLFGEDGFSQGQLDIEGGVWTALTFSRVALRGQVRINRQQPGTFDMRAASPAALLLSTPATRLEIDPGDEFEFTLEPALRVAPALSVGGYWRHYRRGAASLATQDGAELPAFLPTLGRTEGLEWTQSDVGATLTYRSTELSGAPGRGFEAWLQIGRTSGPGHTLRPHYTRIALGLRLVRRLWGD